MSIFACLDHPPPQDLFIADGLFNVLMSFLLICSALIAFAAPVVRQKYRSRVIQLMGLDQVQPRPESWWRANDRRVEENTPSEPSTGSAWTAADLAADAAAWELRVVFATVVAWLSFVLFGVMVEAWSDPGATWIGHIGFAVMAGLLAMGPMAVNLPVRWKRKVLLYGLLVGFVVAGTMELLDPDTLQEVADEEDDWPLWLNGLLLISLFLIYLSLFHRRFRGLVAPLCIVMSVITIVVAVPFVLLEGHLGSCMSGASVDSSHLMDAMTTQFWSHTFTLMAVSFALFGLWLGLSALGGVARLVELGWGDDLSMIGVIGFGVLAHILVYSSIPESGADYPFWINFLPTIWVAIPGLLYLLVLGRRTLKGPGRSLLVLRVFSRNSKQHKLLDQVQSRWRYLGPVHQAGGPDMVDLNIDPYECSMFLSSRLHDLFLPAALSADQLRGRFHDRPGREGRYRINEMFNFNTAWRNNVEQLILMSKTILLDLRGLTAKREGTSYEIGLLAKHGLLGRVVAVGDDQTDWDHVDHQLRQASASLDQLKRVDMKSDQALESLLSELLEISAKA